MGIFSTVSGGLKIAGGLLNKWNANRLEKGKKPILGKLVEKVTGIVKNVSKQSNSIEVKSIELAKPVQNQIQSAVMASSSAGSVASSKNFDAVSKDYSNESNTNSLDGAKTNKLVVGGALLAVTKWLKLW